MPVQSFGFEIKSLGDTGQFVGLASTYSNVDQGGDMVMPGAFQRTLAEGGKSRPLMYEHRTAIGLVTLSDSPAGLIASGQLTMAVQQAKDAYALMQDRVIRGMSIGYHTVRDQVSGGVRQLLELKLFEISLVVFPMNEMAAITSVKSAQRDEISRVARELRDFYKSISGSNHHA